MTRLLPLIVAAGLLLAGCGKTASTPLPKPAQWYGSSIWVPTGYAQSIADAVCRYGGAVGEWHADRYPAGGEILDCEEGVEEQYGEG
jgi:hypothetical protein